MDKSKFDEVKTGVQEIIDLIAEKNAKDAGNKLVEVSEELDELLDKNNLSPDKIAKKINDLIKNDKNE